MSTKRRVIITEAPANREETEKVTRPIQSVSEWQMLMEFSSTKEQYFQIDRQMFFPDTVIDFSIFKQKGMQFGIQIKASSSSPVNMTNEMLRNLSCDLQAEIVIEKTATPRYQAYLDALLEASLSLPENEKIARESVAIKENAKILMKDFLDSPTSFEKLEALNDSVVRIVSSLYDNADTIYDMLTLSKFDYYTYTHSVNVAVLSTGLGLKIGLSKADIVDLGIGTMLHDVGKTALPPQLLNKPSKLDSQEYKIVQGHVRQGGAILQEHNQISEAAFDALLQHHEKLSGTGYPFKLRGQEISLFGRISGIADCYDALTTNRPYRSALTPYNALEVIAQEVGDYDTDIIVDFVKMLGKVKKDAS